MEFVGIGGNCEIATMIVKDVVQEMLDDDMIIHVAPASGGVPVPELAKAFIVPKGCMVKINAAIWHLCPLPLSNEELHAMIILPECTYANDCTVVDFEEKDWFKITV